MSFCSKCSFNCIPLELNYTYMELLPLELTSERALTTLHFGCSLTQICHAKLGSLYSTGHRVLITHTHTPEQLPAKQSLFKMENEKSMVFGYVDIVAFQWRRIPDRIYLRRSIRAMSYEYAETYIFYRSSTDTQVKGNKWRHKFPNSSFSYNVLFLPFSRYFFKESTVTTQRFCDTLTNTI